MQPPPPKSPQHRRLGRLLSLAMLACSVGLVLLHVPDAVLRAAPRAATARRPLAHSGPPPPALAATAGGGPSAAPDSSPGSRGGSAAGLRLLLVGHDLTYTGAPLLLHELALALRARGHSVTFHFLRRGPLEAAVRDASFPYTIAPTLVALSHPPLADADAYDAVLVNCIVAHAWVRSQAEAWGLGWLRRLVWHIHELPVGPLVAEYTESKTIGRHLLARAGAVLFDSQASHSFWERWVLEEAYWIGLDLSPLGARNVSDGTRMPPLPAALPSLQTVRLPVPSWLGPLLGPVREDSASCGRGSGGWRHSAARAAARARLGIAPSDYVVLMVAANGDHKGGAQAVAAFARAWAASPPPGADPGAAMHFVSVGSKMPDLRDKVAAAAAALGGRNGNHAGGDASALNASVHLFDATADHESLLGFYAAADVLVVNSLCENFGRVSLEAAALSLPVLGSSCGGCLETVLPNRTGLLHPPFDEGEASIAKLAENIAALDVRGPARAARGARMGAAGCRRALSEFTAAAFYDGIEGVLTGVASEAAAAHAEATKAATARAAAVRSPAGPGLAPAATAGLTTGWQGAFMPAPHLQAAVRVARYAADWEWQELSQAAPNASMETISIQVGVTLYNVGGYSGTNNVILPTLRTFDMRSLRWTGAAPLPAAMPETHYAVETVARRWAYLLGGQKGPMCSPAVTSSYRLDLESGTFSELPPVPAPRYAPIAVRFGRRLHLMAGLLPDRSTPARDHWSIGLRPDGGVDAEGWRPEAPLPEGAGGSHMVRLRLRPGGRGEPAAVYMWSRTSHEYQPRNASGGDYACVIDREWGDLAMWSFEPRRGWRRHGNLPIPLQHNSQCIFQMGADSALIVGGQHFDRWGSRHIWMYNSTRDSWTRVGTLPVYLKGQACGIHGGRLFVSMGQIGEHNGAGAGFGPIAARQWVAALPAPLAAAAAEAEELGAAEAVAALEELQQPPSAAPPASPRGDDSPTVAERVSEQRL